MGLKVCLVLLAFIFLPFSVFAVDETLTVTTYYPSPYGSYNQFKVASDTWLAYSSGKVGIGTTGPSATLHIQAPDGTQPLLKLKTPGNYQSSMLWIEDEDANPPAGAIATMDLSTGLGLFNILGGAYNDENTYKYGSTRGASRIGLHDNTINMYVSSLGSGGGQAAGNAVTLYQTLGISDSNFIIYTGSGTERVRVDSSGNVGIGTAGPGRKLDVMGATATSVDLGIITDIGNHAADYWVLKGVVSDNSFRILSGGKTWPLDDTNSAVVTMTSAGNVGIGTTSPGAKLDIYHDSNAYTTAAYNPPSLYLTSPNTNGDYTGIGFRNSIGSREKFFGVVQVAANSDDFVWQGYNGSAYQEYMRITSNGSIYTTNWTGASFGSTWGNYGSGYQNVQYKKVGDLVFLRGLANTASAWSSYPTIMTLPAGYRPAARLILDQCANSNVSVRVDIDTAGNVFYLSGGAGIGWISLDGIVFSVD